MKRMIFCLMFVLTLFVASEEKSYAQENNDYLISEEILSSLTSEDYENAYNQLSVIRNTENLTEEELDNQAVIILTNIYESKTIYEIKKNQSNINVSLLSSVELPDSYEDLFAAEKALVKKHPAQALTYYSCTKVAIPWTAKLYNSPQADHHNGNAFKHSFWSACIAFEIGGANAKIWTDAHETESTHAMSIKMDKANNTSGRNAAATLASKTTKFNYHQLHSDYLQDRIKNGHLVRLTTDEKSLRPTDGTGRK